jgi:hypothetical protein
MITNTGKTILAKYLIGQTPSYASYIAIGCGAKPLATATAFGDYSAKKSLDFEMFRVPITSRGYVVDNGVSQVVFTAELPTEERYEITEIGVYSAASNQLAGNYDSRNLYAFSDSEKWEHHTVSPNLAVEIEKFKNPLDVDNNNIISLPGSLTAFQANSDNKLFSSEDRVSRYERCRFLNNIIAIRGDDSSIASSSGGTVPLAINSSWVSGGTTKYSNHIHLTGTSIDLDNNAPTDELRLAFSVVNRVGQDPITPGTINQPESVRILVEFKSTESDTAPAAVQYANFEVDLVQGSGGVDFATNRYFTISKKLEDLRKSSGFTWRAIDVVKISACVIDGGVPSSDFYVCLDAIRVENVTTVNPLYGMTAYTVVKTTDAETIVKSPNTSNFVEFRFGLGIDGV